MRSLLLSLGAGLLLAGCAAPEPLSLGEAGREIARCGPEVERCAVRVRPAFLTAPSVFGRTGGLERHMPGPSYDRDRPKGRRSGCCSSAHPAPGGFFDRRGTGNVE